MPRGTVLSRSIRVTFGVLAVGFAVYAVVDRWPAASGALSRLSVVAILAAFLAIMAALACTFMSWRALLRGLGSPLELRPAARVLFVSQLGKYLPGSVWAPLASVELAHGHDVPRRQAATATVLAMLTTLFGALVVGGLTWPAVASTGVGRVWPALLVIPLLLIVLQPRVVNAAIDRLLRLLGRPPLTQPLSFRTLGIAVAWVLPAWMLLGLHLWLLTESVAPGRVPLPEAIGMFALAWSAGFLFVLAPAGLGAREAVLVAGLVPVMPAGTALALAVVSRLLMTIADLAWAGIAIVLAKPPRPGLVTRGGSGTSPRTAPDRPGERLLGGGAARPVRKSGR